MGDRAFLNAGNWKLNKGPAAVDGFLTDLMAELSEKERASFLIFPPTTSLGQFSALPIKWGAQNIFWESAGAFTGETSAQVVKEMGATHCLVGHSERRILFGETNQLVGKKVAHVQGLKMTPMICVGESEAERNEGITGRVITEQLREALKLADVSAPLIVAYEPVWAIGTGQVATPEISEAAHLILRNELATIGGEDFSQSTQILYGGSVKPGNAGELYKKPNIDGFLVGGASLEVASFIGIFRSCFAV